MSFLDISKGINAQIKAAKQGNNLREQKLRCKAITSFPKAESQSTGKQSINIQSLTSRNDIAKYTSRSRGVILSICFNRSD